MRNAVEFNQTQLTIGQLIELLEWASKRLEDDCSVYYDFGWFAPTDFYSWRGAYDEGCLSIRAGEKALKCSELIGLLKSYIGKTMHGYKGGEYPIHKDCPLWVADSNMSGHTAVFDVITNGYQIILITGYCEY